MTLQKELKREQILDQGIQLLMLHGYHGMGVKLLLDTVNVPKGSFYSYFESKESFTAEAITHYIQPFLRKLEFYLAKPELDGLDSLQAYFSALTEELEHSDYKGGCLLGDMMGEVSSGSDVCRQALTTSINQYCALIEQGLSEAQQAGIVRKDINPSSMARFIFDAWQGALLHMKVARSTVPLERFSTELLGQYLKE